MSERVFLIANASGTLHVFDANVKLLSEMLTPSEGKVLEWP